jgi:phage repressor protein C with HTH and peptisase S24 domain
MGRLIPAGTGMKYYRNVEIAYDNTQNRKEEDEFDEMASNIRGGFDIPILASVPGVDDGDADLEADPSEFETEEEPFDIDEAMKIELDDDAL